MKQKNKTMSPEIAAQEMASTEYRRGLLDLLTPLETRELKLASPEEYEKVSKKVLKKLEARNELAEIRRQEAKKAKGGYVKKYAKGGGVRKVRS